MFDWVCLICLLSSQHNTQRLQYNFQSTKQFRRKKSRICFLFVCPSYSTLPVVVAVVAPVVVTVQQFRFACCSIVYTVARCKTLVYTSLALQTYLKTKYLKQSAGIVMWMILFFSTVKPVYDDHPWVLKFVAVVDRQSIFRGSFMLQKLKIRP